jgi:hypothetical protein
MSDLYVQRGNARRQVIKSRLFNIDNGSGTVLNDAMYYCTQPVQVLSAKVLYTTETAGTVAGATVSVGTTVAGVELVAAIALTNGSTVGAVQALTLTAAAAKVAANTMITVSHTGIATTALGEYYVILEIIPLA